MTDDTQITVTKAELATALGRWEAEAKAEGWANRDDDQRHSDNAEYLIGLIRSARH